MKKLIVYRLLQMLPTVFLVASAVFFLFQLIPGDPAVVFAGEQASAETLAKVREELGLDQPVHVQYWLYVRRLVKFDLGKSFISGVNVNQEIKVRFPNTIRLAFLATLVSSSFGITMGLLSAVKQDSILDYGLTTFALLGMSIPVFWLGLILIYIFGVQLKMLPIAGNASWQHYLMPVFVLASYATAATFRITRSSVLETMGGDFVRTARAKGAREYTVIFRHVLRNSLIPVVTVIGLQFGYMLGGSIITETIFAWPGMGRLLVMAVNQRDVMVVQGCLIIFSSCFVIVNLVVEVAYVFVDPRISYS